MATSTGTGWKSTSVHEIPPVKPDWPATWKSVRHHFGITAFGINAVSKDKKAIGYGGIAYAKGIKVLKVSREDQSPAIEATMANVVSGKYPLSRFLYFYTAGQPDGEVKAFIDWVLGAEGQKICSSVGYFPLTKSKKDAP